MSTTFTTQGDIDELKGEEAYMDEDEDTNLEFTRELMRHMRQTLGWLVMLAMPLPGNSLMGVRNYALDWRKAVIIHRKQGASLCTVRLDSTSFSRMKSKIEGPWVSRLDH